MGRARFIAVFSQPLDQLLSLAEELTPRIELYPPDGLCLEVTPRLESKALKDLHRRSVGKIRRSPPAGPLRATRAGSEGTVSFSWGVASTRTAALLMARAKPGTVIPRGREGRLLSPLSVQWLGRIRTVHPELLMTFARWGIRSLGQLAALPESELVARLGQEGLLLQKLSQGEDIQPFQAYREKPDFTEHQELDWELDSIEALSFILGGMLDRLCACLWGYGLAAESIRISLKLANGAFFEQALKLAYPMRDPRVILSLLRLDLQARHPQAAILEVHLEAEPAAPRVFQFSLLQTAVPNPEKLSRTVARLKVLVGEARVGSPMLLDTHRPDAFAVEPFQVAEPKRARQPFPSPSENPPVVLRRVRPPVTFRYRSQEIVACSGPWRTSGDWWKGDNEWAHHEWDVQLTDGRLCRIYWDCYQRRWFLEGIYD